MGEGRGTCRYCDQPIYWFVSRAGKYYPCDSDSKRSFHVCGKRENSDSVVRMMQEIIRTGYRRLSLQLHPDRSGNHGDMVALNAAVRRLRECVR